jgi:hypothetical protein
MPGPQSNRLRGMLQSPFVATVKRLMAAKARSACAPKPNRLLWEGQPPMKDQAVPGEWLPCGLSALYRPCLLSRLRGHTTALDSRNDCVIL